jgi:hypothetical protein
LRKVDQRGSFTNSAFEDFFRNHFIAVEAEETELNFGATWEYAVRNSKMSSSEHESKVFCRVRTKHKNRWKCIL